MKCHVCWHQTTCHDWGMCVLTPLPRPVLFFFSWIVGSNWQTRPRALFNARSTVVATQRCSSPICAGRWTEGDEIDTSKPLFSPLVAQTARGRSAAQSAGGAAGNMGALVGEERELKSEQRVEARTYVPLNIHFMGAHRDYCPQGGPALVDFVCCNHTWFFFPCLSSAVITCTLSFSDEEFTKRPT